MRKIALIMDEWKRCFTYILAIKKLLEIKELREATTRFELVIEVLQTFALPLGHGAISHY